MINSGYWGFIIEIENKDKALFLILQAFHPIVETKFEAASYQAKL